MNKKIIQLLIASMLIGIIFTGCVEEEKTPETKEETYFDIASAFMTQLTNKNYAPAYQYFNQNMKNAISESQLEALWNYYIATYGEFKEIISTSQQTIENNEIIYFNLTFELNYLIEFKIVFEEETLIAGFWEVSHISLIGYRSPEYVNQQNFTETNITIGTQPWELPATLTIPAGDDTYPCIILVHGSGPNDRDETIGPNKPFKDLAWGFASKGIAVLRYDKRTYIYPEELATDITLTLQEEVIDDALAAVNYLKQHDQIDTNKIYVLGHSLGGMMAPQIAQSDSTISGLILLAAPARPLEDLITNQTYYLANLDGTINEEEQQQIDLIAAEVQKIKSLNFTEEEKALSAYKAYWDYLSTYDQVATAKNLTISLFILQGKRDYQVTYEDDYLQWVQLLTGKENVAYQTYETLNHLFIHGGGTPTNTEYMTEGHVSADVINDIIQWMQYVEEK